MENNMTFDEYKHYIRVRLKEYLPKEYQEKEVILMTELKNNRVVLTGVSILADEQINPVVYINESYEKYQTGYPVEKILKSLADRYVEAIKNRTHVVPGTVEKLISMLSSYEEIKNRVIPRICNTRENADLLLECPHTIYEDLSVTYHVVLSEDVRGKSVVRITNNFFSQYGINIEEFHEQAMENLKIRGHKVLSIEDRIFEATISKLMVDFDVSYEEAETLTRNVYDMKEKSGLCVLSSEDGEHGAIWMLSEEVREEIAEFLGEDYYVLPSSTHEVLVVPKSMKIPPEELKEMVNNVNAYSVAPEERLSDNVYEYDSKEKKLQLATSERAHEHEHEKEQSMTR